ncbi:hemoglobin cathodic subunit beta-like [Lampris incognitus]|uniref:hemoglobin cathodic subunit beta-like n=1 Tax=Lampris incognitus TaxID=2546036 RepID=UPI0024B54BE5|nr:hemoglobin cathodic subunit beta-like [Lampris incognitus]XP_056143141.1 hemoglobin cathodic subunit beta-like [Lampris incognitus]XP_056143143.1 hemoglobin cathodic subunit beta-like [Lampris incognitus]
MVRWTDSERSTIISIWSRVNVDDVGPQALARVLIVYPWTERYFSAFGNISDADALLKNARVAAHGKVLLRALGEGVRHMDNIKNFYAPLGRQHREEFSVDPDTFRLFADCLTIVMASKLSGALSPQAQATWQKFLTAVVEALGSQYV